MAPEKNGCTFGNTNCFQTFAYMRVSRSNTTYSETQLLSSCGHLQIPYPFGFGPDRYLVKWFEIDCNTTGGSAKAFLTSMNMEVRQINISSSPLNRHYSFVPTVQVQIPIIYSKFCQIAGNHSVTNISRSPFNFSASDNTFISVGCDNFATIAGIFSKVFGCKSDCKRD